MSEEFPAGQAIWSEVFKEVPGHQFKQMTKRRLTNGQIEV